MFTLKRKRKLKKPLEIIEVNSDGDTIITYRYEAFDFGKVYTGKPDTATAKTPRTTEGLLQGSGIAMRTTGIDTGKSVGKIPFSEGTTPSGGRTYAIPVLTAPVVSSAPQVAIVYNSQSGNGIAGYGWNVTGTSVITIGSRSIYYDSAVSPVDLNNPLNNALFLDGTRLVTNTGSLTEYQYESAQGFVLVKRHMYGNNISYFTVAYPNGSVATFGFTNNTQNKLTYPLTSVTDIKGYRVDFEYTTSGNNYYVSAIKYGGKAQDQHPAHIFFTYVSRTDFTPAYSAGLELKQDRLLTKVVSYNNGAELRTYSLSHTFKDGASLLAQLDCSVGTSSLNPLTFDYGSEYESGEGYLVQDAHIEIVECFPQSAKPIYSRGKFIKNKFNDGLITFPGVFSSYGVVREKVKKFLGIIVGGPWYEFGSLISCRPKHIDCSRAFFLQSDSNHPYRSRFSDHYGGRC